VFRDNLGDIVARAQAAGLDRILTVGSDFPSSVEAVKIARDHETVYAAIGVHPNEATTFFECRDEVRALLTERKVVAIGEIGLDYVREGVHRQVQREVFAEQLTWAVEESLPVSVHNRGAGHDVLTLLREAGATAVLHCFSGSWDFARAALDEGFFLSFAGNLTFPRSKELRDVAARMPLQRILVETDTPVLAPQSRRGQTNEPAFAVETLECLASVRDLPVYSASEAISTTADSVFGWREP
jgi:TatD DNase family protein